jgi:hypothetical protein
MLDRDQIETLALKIYDELNPESNKKIMVSKAECIKIAQERLSSRTDYPSEREKRLLRKEIPDKRRLIRTAFDLVRHDPTETAIKRNFSLALGGKMKITETLLDSAQRIISERAQ